MSVLAASDLRISYNGREVVHGISFEIEEGETLALVGESGSGKSTTAHAILGLLPSGGTVDGGSVVLGDLDISGWTDRALRGIRGAEIGLVPQDPTTSLDPVRPIGAQVVSFLAFQQRVVTGLRALAAAGLARTALVEEEAA